ncbi:peptidase [Ruegeria marisrubri]|uniref:Parvulin-like PPIase n=1 Tax=Ruegeria marisrubri TaxID=1685379 RepID=A0A0X3UEX3_9RHOB|nr:peptidylprolyl isomerase [Ruegeria marisrubri]KUJ85466.1 peptidase [Ruegeria marisrubri]
MPAALFPDLVVNGETVPHTAVAAEAQNHSGPKGKPGIAWRKAANAVAIRTLLLQEARKCGLTPEPAEVGPGRFETDEEALIRGLLEQEIDVTAPTEEEVRAEWARGPERFRAPPLWEVSHILCAFDPGDETAKEAARARAEELCRRAHATPEDFPRLASEHSDCGSKSAGGALGQLGPGSTVPEFEAHLRELAEGEISNEPLLTRYGWHVVRMDAAAPGDVLPFDTVRDKIAEAMEKARWASEAGKYVNRLVEAAEISGADLGPV